MIESGRFLVKKEGGCSAITTIYLDDSLTNDSLANNAPHFGQYAFADTGVTTVTFESGIQEIGDHMFRYSNRLQNVEIPASIGANIGDYAFADSSSLTNFKVYGSTIGQYMFFNTAIAEFDEDNYVLASLTTIGYAAFGGCNDLTTMLIPFSGKNAQNSTTGTFETLFGYIFGHIETANSIPVYQKHTNKVISFLKQIEAAYKEEISTPK